jgi:myo-inositol-1(or 4)-monophosphatase
MADYDRLLVIARDAACEAMQALAAMTAGSSSYKFADDLPREMKSTADYELEKIILACLAPTDLPILSEEIGELRGFYNDGLRWVVDPLDGTVNFIRGLAPCAVSIALWSGDVPVFGVIGEFPSFRLAWGGRSFGAFIESSPIHVSTVQKSSQAILCTGFPSRFEFTNASASNFWEMASSFRKVRMLGAASLSLLKVACGAADTYFEDQIMLWDIAAGLAIIQGAGGNFRIDLVSATRPCCVIAANSILLGSFNETACGSQSKLVRRNSSSC